MIMRENPSLLFNVHNVMYLIIIHWHKVLDSVFAESLHRISRRSSPKTGRLYTIWCFINGRLFFRKFVLTSTKNLLTNTTFQQPVVFLNTYITQIMMLHQLKRGNRWKIFVNIPYKWAHEHTIWKIIREKRYKDANNNLIDIIMNSYSL